MVRTKPLRAAAVAALAVLCMFFAASESARPSEPAAARLPAPPLRPNVVLILLDDATMENVEAMPITQALVAEEGVTFTQTYSPFPLCCPARATILTGQYAHNHGVLDNVEPQGGYATFDDSQTLATYLTDDYRTGLFGKYMNDSDDQRGYVPPGWDVFVRPLSVGTYWGTKTTMWVNGRVERLAGAEQTAALSRRAQRFISTSTAAGKPFFTFLSVVSPHFGGPHTDYPADPTFTSWVAPRYRNTAARVLPDDPSVNEADVTDKPAYVQARPLMTDDDLALAAERYAQTVEAVQAVDAEVGNVVDRLDSLGVLDNTYVMVASDNGFALGQHRKHVGKNDPGQAAVHVPLIMRGPGLIPGTTYDRVAGLQDITPTILAMTNESDDQATASIDGLDLLGLATGELAPSNRLQLIEIPYTAGITDQAAEAGREPSPEKQKALKTLSWRWRGFVTSGGLKYLETVQTGEVELYNLNTDPFELINLANDGLHDHLVATMAARLAALARCSGSSCH
jgi:N-acetylglucosamine-6-sulfatase